MDKLPIYIDILFELTVILTIGWFYLTTRSRSALIIILVWTALQSILGLSGIYQDTQTIPPKIMLFGVFPTILAMVLLFVSSKGRSYIDRMDLKTVTYFHTIRVPVEIVLALLYYQGAVSVYMTFEGTNFDIFSGISAPVAAYLAFSAKNLKRNLLIGWNVVCLLLLLNVVITAVFAIPSPFQRLAFDQPNIAVLHFPYNLLPTVVVPLVLLAHLAALRKLLRGGND